MISPAAGLHSAFGGVYGEIGQWELGSFTTASESQAGRILIGGRRANWWLKQGGIGEFLLIIFGSHMRISTLSQLPF